jgi:hypothetical protein
VNGDDHEAEDDWILNVAAIGSSDLQRKMGKLK